MAAGRESCHARVQPSIGQAGTRPRGTTASSSTSSTSLPGTHAGARTCAEAESGQLGLGLAPGHPKVFGLQDEAQLAPGWHQQGRQLSAVPLHRPRQHLQHAALLVGLVGGRDLQGVHVGVGVWVWPALDRGACWCGWVLVLRAAQQQLQIASSRPPRQLPTRGSGDGEQAGKRAGRRAHLCHRHFHLPALWVELQHHLIHAGVVPAGSRQASGGQEGGQALKWVLGWVCMPGTKQQHVATLLPDCSPIAASSGSRIAAATSSSVQQQQAHCLGHMTRRSASSDSSVVWVLALAAAQAGS